MLLVSVVMLFGLPSVMEGDHGDFGEKSSHLKPLEEATRFLSPLFLVDWACPVLDLCNL
jgi:hypothetical protein